MSETPASPLPQTLLALAGRTIPLPDLATSILVLIDLQNEYLAGPLVLDGADAAVAAAVRLLGAVRAAGGRVVHVAHAGRPGGFFDRTAARGAFADVVAPQAGEAVVEKRAISRPARRCAGARRPGAGPATLTVSGLMTHNRASPTVRPAGALGHAIVVAHDACATRALPGPDGVVVGAATLGRAALAGIADRFCRLASVAEIVGAG